MSEIKFLAENRRQTIERYTDLWTRYLDQIKDQKDRLIIWIDSICETDDVDRKKNEHEKVGIRRLVDMSAQEIGNMVADYFDGNTDEPRESMYHILDLIVKNKHGLFK